jgi:hypothetical protein
VEPLLESLPEEAVDSEAAVVVGVLALVDPVPEASPSVTGARVLHPALAATKRSGPPHATSILRRLGRFIPGVSHGVRIRVRRYAASSLS